MAHDFQPLVNRLSNRWLDAWVIPFGLEDAILVIRWMTGQFLGVVADGRIMFIDKRLNGTWRSAGRRGVR